MKFRITLGAALLVLGGFEASDPVHLFWFAPSAHANEQTEKSDDHERTRQERAEDDHDHDEHTDKEHVGHEDHSEDEHAEHDEGGAIRLTAEVMREFGIEIKIATDGSIARSVRLPGEVVFNADRIAHVSPTVEGSVKRVNVSVGDHVEAGQTMAVLNSRELAAARSEYLAAVARLELAQENLSRDRRLFAEKVGTKRAAIASKQAYRESEIALSQAENTLHALGYSHQQITRLTELEDTAFNTYEMLAPLSGIVTQRHITIGEVIGLDDDDAPFVVADLSSVWVNLTVYQRDLAHVRAGLPVSVEFGSNIPDAQGTVAFVSPALDETTRTATARVVLDNPRGDFCPGLFVSGLVETGQAIAAVVVPNSAVTELDGRTSTLR